MKTLKILTLAFLTLMSVSCSKNDDTDNTPVQEDPVELTTADLLVSGKWFVNGISGTSLDSCEQQTYFHFIDSNTLIVESFGLNGGVCESNTLNTYDYSLANPLINIQNGATSVLFEIEFISETQLVLSTDSGGGTATYNLVK
ncbi:lipocalin family protein [Ulvibacter antarcticus]|uniref:Lipocalin-like protein n=1 Tax=Ulvibacter antarcticus TaxID=442714 RepID=A0A3L9YCF6_9FLAO|nr:lipocalin family protein [Ulvibacter antarcticus]RMA57177.1 lipocalin-like protein [Ulvibacter antarcticus]